MQNSGETNLVGVKNLNTKTKRKKGRGEEPESEFELELEGGDAYRNEADEESIPVEDGSKANDIAEKPVIEAKEVRPTVTMACVPRLGSFPVVGPVTGRHYIISNTGTSGIDLEDAEEIRKTPIPVRCLRTGGWKDIIPAGITSYDF